MHDLTNHFLAEIYKGLVFHAIKISTNSNDFPPALFEETERFLTSLDVSRLSEGSTEKTKLQQIQCSALFLMQSLEHYLEKLSRPDSPFRGVFKDEAHLRALSQLQDDPDFGRAAKQLRSAYYNLHGLFLHKKNDTSLASRKFAEGIACTEPNTIAHAILSHNIEALSTSMLNTNTPTYTPSFDSVSTVEAQSRVEALPNYDSAKDTLRCSA